MSVFVLSVQTWNPKSKIEPYARSAVELMKLAKETIHDFFELPVEITVDLVKNLADTLGQLFEEYTALVASCGRSISSSSDYPAPLIYSFKILACSCMKIDHLITEVVLEKISFLALQNQ